MSSSNGTFLRPRGSTLSRFDTAFDWDSDFEEGFMCDDDYLETAYPHINRQRPAVTGQSHTLEAKVAHQAIAQHGSTLQQQQQTQMVPQKKVTQPQEAVQEAIVEPHQQPEEDMVIPKLPSSPTPSPAPDSQVACGNKDEVEDVPVLSDKVPSNPEVKSPVEVQAQQPRPSPIILHRPSDVGRNRTRSSATLAKRLTNPPPSPVTEEREEADGSFRGPPILAPSTTTTTSSSSSSSPIDPSSSSIDPPSRPMTPLSPSSTRASTQSDCETLAERVPDLVCPKWEHEEEGILPTFSSPPTTPPLSRLGIPMDSGSRADSVHPGPPSLSDQASLNEDNFVKGSKMSELKEDVVVDENKKEGGEDDEEGKEEEKEKEEDDEKEEDVGPPLLVITAPSSPAHPIDLSRDLTEVIDDPALLTPPAFYSEDEEDDWCSDVEDEDGYERDEEDEVDHVLLDSQTPKVSIQRLEEGHEQQEQQRPLEQRSEGPLGEETPLLRDRPSYSSSTEENQSFPPPRFSWKEASVVVDRTVPISLACILTQSLPLISLISIGHLGKEALASAALGNLIIAVTGHAVVTGAGSAVDTLCSQAYGSDQKDHPLFGDALGSGVMEDEDEAESEGEENTLMEAEVTISDDADSPDRSTLILEGHLMRGAMAMTILTILLAFPWCFGVEWTLSHLTSHPPEIITMTGVFVRWTTPGLWPMAMFELARRYFQAQGYMAMGTWVLVLVLPFHLILNWALVWWSPLAIGFIGAPLATSLSQWACFLLSLVYGWRVGLFDISFKSMTTGLGRLIRFSLTGWGPFLRLGK